MNKKPKAKCLPVITSDQPRQQTDLHPAKKIRIL